MGKVKESTTKLKSWSEINKTRKEEKRKWKEINLKKKLQKQVEPQSSGEACTVPDPPKTVATVSIAVPGSILETAQTPELRTYLAGQIARAACMFQVDEIVVFDDYADEANAKKATVEDEDGVRSIRDSCMQLGRILQYLECPQYLRKHFFPIHAHLKYCGILNPLNAPHHLSKTDFFDYREGIVLNKTVKAGRGSLVNVGLLKEVQVDKLLSPGLRCTVRLLEETTKKWKGIIVPPSTPRADKGVYWGYVIRLANSLSKVFSQSPHKEGYDLTIGTSDKGTSIDEFACPQFKHALIVFGGVEGLEFALENDDVLEADDPRLLFDHYLNSLPRQASKTIRTEEAILITLASLRPKLQINN
ncbi:hypothetical protein Zmor_027734 [Zophobas morio]|uniref:Uncharacterized protein n=1 Tax=Zophobas morio TaxID=2755281 RepID=A0AA38HTZ6_9CUCU|nr:hypothetical protein Zmor_027734 [Zophobas morio]